MLLFRLFWPSQIPVSPPIPIIRLNHWGGVCARTCAFVGVCVCVQIWQDDLIHQGLPPPSLGGTKIILQRGTFTFTRIHAHNPPLTPRPGNWLGAAEPCYSTHTQTHMQAQTPISLNLATCLCIRTSSVSPPLGCAVHSEAICLISPASSLSFSPSTCLYFLSLACTCTISSPRSVSLSFFILLLPHTQRLHAHHFLPVPPFPTHCPPLQARRHHRGAAEDRAHWQARVAVTYCLLMECDKSCGNAGVRGSESQGVEYVSVPVCVLASQMCVCLCMYARMCLCLFCVHACVCVCA